MDAQRSATIKKAMLLVEIYEGKYVYAKDVKQGQGFKTNCGASYMGKKMDCMMVFKKVELELSHKYACKAYLLVLDMGTIDIVLGCDWLVTFGSFIMNLQLGFMSFMHGNDEVKFEEVRMSKIKMINATQLKREMKKMRYVYVLQLCKESGDGVITRK